MCGGRGREGGEGADGAVNGMCVHNPPQVHQIMGRGACPCGHDPPGRVPVCRGPQKSPTCHHPGHDLTHHAERHLRNSQTVFCTVLAITCGTRCNCTTGTSTTMSTAAGELTGICLVATTGKSMTLEINCNCGTSRRCLAPVVMTIRASQGHRPPCPRARLDHGKKPLRHDSHHDLHA